MHPDQHEHGGYIEQGLRYQLTSPTLAPNADAFLYNPDMMLQITCRGYATAQFMQPEPTKYAHGPTLAAKTFMQPEHPYFAHHAGRFFYLKDRDSGRLHSAPYEPVRESWDDFAFEPGTQDIRWRLRTGSLTLTLTLSLATDTALECWQVTLKNNGESLRNLSLVPYFPVGYASWMNQSADVHPHLNAIIARSVAPYQKLEDYPRQKTLKQLTFLAASEPPTSWCARMQAFEGEGGLHNPSQLQQPALDETPSLYECPACIQQFDIGLEAGEEKHWTFLFGPAFDDEEIAQLCRDYFAPGRIELERRTQAEHLNTRVRGFQICSPDDALNHAINVWLPRQLLYHGETQRLTTDPQTRNYLQDAMGMSYLDPTNTRLALETALQQQKPSGQMPDGILLEGATELKFINQIPHTDHGIWVILCVQAYLSETADYDWLHTELPFAGNEQHASVFDHVCRSLDWLIQDRDSRGLSFIQQGDWCDPMNMVGPNGIGVSAWLTQALAVALNQWSDICQAAGNLQPSKHYATLYAQVCDAVQTHCWDGDWFIRGITDEQIRFGTHQDAEGQIFLNTQSWALLGSLTTPEQTQKILAAVADRLDTPFGAQLCAPAFTHMHEHIGRVTQKFPGTAENGSVYNHAAMFWCAALYRIGESNRAFQALFDLWSFNDNDIVTRGQLPIYVPNYYRGAFFQYPEVAGRSSRLFNTGTVAWAYKLVIEKLCGFQGTADGLRVQPQLPDHWPNCSATRHFRGSDIRLTIVRNDQAASDSLYCNDRKVEGFELTNLQPGQRYELHYVIATPDSL